MGGAAPDGDRQVGSGGLRPEPGGSGVRPVRDAQRPVRQGEEGLAAAQAQRRAHCRHGKRLDELPPRVDLLGALGRVQLVLVVDDQDAASHWQISPQLRPGLQVPHEGADEISRALPGPGVITS